MQVHLVAVEVGIVGSRGYERETERVPGHEPHAVGLHSVHVERRLSVEDNDVVVLQEALDDVADTQHELVALLAHFEVGHRAVTRYDVRSAVQRRTSAHALVHFYNVRRVDRLRYGELECDRVRHADAIALKVSVGRDDAASAEVDSFPHQVSAHSPLLPFESVSQALDCGCRRATHPRWPRYAHVAANEHENLVLQPVESLLYLGCHAYVGSRHHGPKLVRPSQYL